MMGQQLLVAYHDTHGGKEEDGQQFGDDTAAGRIKAYVHDLSHDLDAAM